MAEAGAEDALDDAFDDASGAGRSLIAGSVVSMSGYLSIYSSKRLDVCGYNAVLTGQRDVFIFSSRPAQYNWELHI
ncbi:hypothetical protein [Paraburkholderia jirisanensis]